MIWTSETVATILGTDRPDERSFAAISTDSRTVGRDALFVALVGDRFDGHNYLAVARDARKGPPLLRIESTISIIRQRAFASTDEK